MKRSIAILASAVAAMALVSSSADAKSRKTDPRIVATEAVSGVASTLTWAAIIGWDTTKHSSGFNWGAAGWVTLGCAVVSPVVASVVVNRPLTTREFYSVEGSCIVPIIGGWLAESIYDANNPPPAKHKKKMKM